MMKGTSAQDLELVKDVSSLLDVTALCHKIFLHIHGLIAADRYSLFLVCEDSSNDKFLISHLFDVAEGSTLEEASNNCIRLEWNKGIVGHVAALGKPLNIKDAYEVNREPLEPWRWAGEGNMGRHWTTTVNGGVIKN